MTTTELLCPECGGGRMHHLTFAHTTGCTLRAADDQTAANDALQGADARSSRFTRPATVTEILLLRPLLIDPKTEEDRYVDITVFVHHYGIHARTVTGIDRYGHRTTVI